MSAITTIAGSDVIGNSRAVINTNFSNLNTDKIETSVLDTDTTLAANSDSKIATQKAVKAYVDAGGNPQASTTQAGIVEIATAAEFAAGTSTGGTGAYLLAPISMLSSLTVPRNFHNIPFGEVDSTNIVMGYSDDPNKIAFCLGGTIWRVLDLTNGTYQTRTGTADFAAADNVCGLVIIGLYIYILYQDTGLWAFKVYRYLLSNVAAGGTLMTISGTAFGTSTVNPYMNSDGTNFYFSYQGMNSGTNQHVISKYSLSGTTLTYVSDITCGATAANLARYCVRAADGHIIGCNSSDMILRRYNTSGVLQATGLAAVTDGYQYFGLNFSGAYYFVGTNAIAGRLLYTRVAIP